MLTIALSILCAFLCALGHGPWAALAGLTSIRLAIHAWSAWEDPDHPHLAIRDHDWLIDRHC